MKKIPPPPPGMFEATVLRHFRFCREAGADKETAIRFVTPDGREWINASSYMSVEHKNLLFVDLELAPVQFEPAGNRPRET